MIKHVNMVDVPKKYRLGDIAKHGNKSCTASLNYPESIGAKYTHYMLENKVSFDWNKLRELAREHSDEGTEGLAVHFRMGDKHIPIGTINEFIGTILETGINDITIVGAIHHHIKEHDGNGERELSIIVDALRENGRVVKVRSSENPDDDFAFLVNSKNMHTSIGGFSMVSALCNSGNITHGTEKSCEIYDMYKSFGIINIDKLQDSGLFALKEIIKDRKLRRAS